MKIAQALLPYPRIKARCLFTRAEEQYTVSLSATSVLPEPPYLLPKQAIQPVSTVTRL